MSDAAVPAVVLAGGRAKPELAAFTGQDIRALVPVNGKTLLRHVVEALHEVGQGRGKVTVLGDLPDAPDYERLADTGDFVGNVFAGVERYADAPFVLIATADLPFINGPSLDDFVCGARRLAEESGAGFVWPVVPVAECYRRFPGVKRTSLKLREGEFTGGNLMLLRPAALLPQRERLAAAYAARKSPARLASMLGLGTVGKLLVSQTVAPRLLTLPSLERSVAGLLGTTVRAYISAYPEIATDLDRPEDFAAVGVTLTSTP